MEERGGVLVQNEKHANKSVAKVMRITFLIFSIVFLLNVFGIFVVDMKIMAIAYILGSILLWVPTIIVNIAKLDGIYIKYVLTVCNICNHCDINLGISCSTFIHLCNCDRQPVLF